MCKYMRHLQTRRKRSLSLRTGSVGHVCGSSPGSQESVSYSRTSLGLLGLRPGTDKAQCWLLEAWGSGVLKLRRIEVWFGSCVSPGQCGETGRLASLCVQTRINIWVLTNKEKEKWLRIWYCSCGLLPLFLPLTSSHVFCYMTLALLYILFGRYAK